MGIADALDYGHLPLVVQLLYGRHVGVKPDVVIDGKYLVFVDPHIRPVVNVQGVAVGDYGIEGVVAPGQLKHHQHRVFFGRGHYILLL